MPNPENPADNRPKSETTKDSGSEEKDIPPVTEPVLSSPQVLPAREPLGGSETINIVSSPDAALASPILDDPAGFNVAKAMDIQGFPEFLSGARRLGIQINIEDRKAVQRRFEAFAAKDTVARKVESLHREKISGERGISFDEEGERAIREHIERQALLVPEAIKILAEEFEKFERLSAEVKDLNSQFDPLRQSVSAAEATQQEKVEEQNELQRKRETLDIAEKTNRFWPTLKSLTFREVTGWGWLSGASKKAREARREAKQEMNLGSKGIGAVVTLGAGLDTRRILDEQKRISREFDIGAGELAAGAQERELLLHIEEKKKKGEQNLADAKNSLAHDAVLTDKLVGIVNKKLIERFNAVIAPDVKTTVDAAQEVFELLKKAEDARSRIPSDKNFLGGIDLAKSMKAIENIIKGIVWEEFEDALSEIPVLSASRFSHLEQRLEKFAAKGRLGSKDRKQIREFIVRQLTFVLEVMEKEGGELNAEPKGDENEKARKSRQMTELRQKAILIQTLVASQKKRLLSEDTPQERLPHSESSFAAENVSSLSPEGAVVAPPVLWTTKRVNEMTFNKVMELDSPLLRKVVLAVKPVWIADALRDEPKEVVEKALGSLTKAERAVFETLLNNNVVNSNAYAANLKDKILNEAKKVLVKEIPVSSPGE